MAQPPMTQFWPIFATKSDGQSIVTQKNKPMRNGPTEQQLDKKPNDQGQCDFYRLIAKDDPKHIDWRKKLGGMLLREIGGKQHEDKWQQCILWELPENYVLYEHIKTKADGQVKTVKNHSGGGHDRQDAYLYGYPRGPKKRFRSPVEFFPHLLWLCTDDDSNPDNCTCKMCSPTGDVDKPAFKADASPAFAVTVKREPTPNAPAAVIGRSAPAAQVQGQVQVAAPRRLSTGPPAAQSPHATPATPVSASAPAPSAQQQPQQSQQQPQQPQQPQPLPQQIRAPPPAQSTPLPQPRSLEQQTDLSYHRFLCRTGEVVWFFRPKTSAWGLGLVIRRWALKDTPNDRSYLIQPLSHPFESPAQELVTSDDRVKPWLAWSAPSCTFPYLQQNPHLSYDQVDWRALESGQYGEGIASVDASIMAAKAIDSTYTLFDRLQTSTDGRQELRHFNGIYLGAEKIWRGEAVRLRLGSGSDLMVITDIIERVYPQTKPNTPPPTSVSVVGDIYSYATLEAPDPSNPPKPPQQNSNLPTRMVYDMAWRNRTLVPSTRSMAWWKLIYGGSRLDIAEIKGRWYETSVLFQEPFAIAVKNGEGGNGIWMNSRGDATGLGKNAGVVRPDRIAAFGQSVPQGIRLIEGLDPPSQQVPAQQPQQHQLHEGMGLGAGNEALTLDDLINGEHVGEETGMQFDGAYSF